MKKLPSKGWGPWRREFYSLYSNPKSQEEDINHEFGVWHNVWLGKISSIVYKVSPKFWVWTINLPPLRYRILKDLKKHFPNMR